MSRFQISARTRRGFWVLCALSLFLSVWLNSFLGIPSLTLFHRTRTVAIAQSTDVGQLVQSGIERYERGLFSEAIEPWQTAYEIYEVTEDLSALAIVSENLARAYQQLGQPTNALTYWERAIAAGQASGRLDNAGRLLTEQAQAYSQLGQPRRAIAILCGGAVGDCVEGSALQLASVIDDTSTQVAALGSLGEAYRLLGDERTSVRYLEKGLALSQGTSNAALESAILNGLGTVYIRMADIRYRQASEASLQGDSEASALEAQAVKTNGQAFSYLQQSYDIAVVQQNEETQLRSLISLIPVAARAGNTEAVERCKRAALLVAEQLPSSQSKAFALLKLADLLEVDASADAFLTSQPWGRAPVSLDRAVQMESLLTRSLAIGEEIDNSQVVAFSLGKLGHLDERAKRYESAMARTQAARLAASQDTVAKESLYLWDWQMGRLLSATGKEAAAEQVYAQAVALLEQIRAETLSASRELQFDFRDTVEPVYRQYAALSLEAVPSAIPLEKGENAFEALGNTLTTIDALKVAELQSYFANDCIIAPVTARVDALDDGQMTAAITTAVVGDGGEFDGQLVAIVSLPDGSKQVARIEADEQTVKDTVVAFRKGLESSWVRVADYDQSSGRRLYEWLIEPFEPVLEEVETLVFVNDGLLRSVPMGALYDGERYLVERFAIALTPSLTLTTPERVERPAELNALLMGVSDSSVVRERAFGALLEVPQELERVAQVLSDSKVLLNEAFSKEALRSTLAASDYRILHVATHGSFGFDPNDNFVVLGAKEKEDAASNQVLTIGELDEILRETSGPTRRPVELLTLTACDTAVGDTRATLGLAGVAVRAGVRSAIATLWSVEDASSALLISDFYKQLRDTELTKAQALQRAQVAMIRSEEDPEYRHPYRWAPFVLIGNWL